MESQRLRALTSATEHLFEAVKVRLKRSRHSILGARAIPSSLGRCSTSFKELSSVRGVDAALRSELGSEETSLVTAAAFRCFGKWQT